LNKRHGHQGMDGIGIGSPLDKPVVLPIVVHGPAGSVTPKIL
jgi:hypothetical protein